MTELTKVVKVTSQLTVGELVKELEGLNPEMPVTVYSELLAIFAPVIRVIIDNVELDDGGHVEIMF